jgi:hypothetical protein
MGAKEEDVFELLHYDVCTKSRYINGICGIPITSLKRESTYRKKLLDFFFERIMSGKPTMVRDIIEAGFTTEHWTDDEIKKEFEPRSANKKTVSSRMKKSACDSAIKKIVLGSGIPSSNAVSFSGSYCGLTKITGFLNELCTSGQLGILQSMILNGYGDNEYTAFCIALKWAAERLEAEKAAKGQS